MRIVGTRWKLVEFSQAIGQTRANASSLWLLPQGPTPFIGDMDLRQIMNSIVHFAIAVSKGRMGSNATSEIGTLIRDKSVLV
jgi:hypothetical protein